MEKNKSKFIFVIIEILIASIFLGTLALFIYHLFKINIFPIKYLILGIVFFVLLTLICFYFLFSKKRKVSKLIVVILLLFFSFLFIFGNQYIKNTYNFFKNTKAEFDTLTYSVLVLKDHSIQELGDLENKEILYLDDYYAVDIKAELEKQVLYKEHLVQDFGSLLDPLLNKEIHAIVLENGSYNLLKEEIEGFEAKTKVIYTFDVKIKAHEENQNTAINITMEPFILYISGVDQWGNVKSVRGRSDVNMLVIVNPKTNQILLVNTPRDYYIQLDGTKGLKDKLTHAGIYGIDKSIKTLENFYDIDISHYLRVNFDSVIKIIDVIGGIDINSDKAFKPRNDSRYINKGWNHFDGKLALAYARERYAYTTGDHHRGANQQQVITAIIEKLTSSSVLISKYNTLLDSLNGSFQTDMSMEEITSFIKYQIDKMPSWKVESIAVTGTGDMQPTYSMGSKLKLYVMNPDMKSVKMAQEKIKEVLNAD